MKQHQYRITVEHLADKDGNAVERKALQFDAPNHDDIFEIVERTKEREGMSDNIAERFAVGLKLMTEPMMEDKDNPLFSRLRPHIMEMMKIIKQKDKHE
ncbi:DUF3861 domain-containing protein [Bisgaard Taxon 10/6]|uniref:DUF3861 domain-containing protein n=1 Tax=Exercitatus varius TaxID=67857 RepID=A0AAW6QCV2_9PAST|nr:DUF3861 domain-containing protein [Exercitatus varius]MDG2917675.1 DUF3861 domain-containing protein [Exercitatus varius]MDG2939900.1 DUF3861 domain-containing protein [Exercitatus varius]MDG2941735.1 DUF3861 domain-containing protein [Exercitatus varius]MDG2949950.1 DUF3861 domain-containing protein [Exercitatus varius]MDG2952851.1 DUF3861 domain-containing protein [Exercitatus varius]